MADELSPRTKSLLVYRKCTAAPTDVSDVGTHTHVRINSLNLAAVVGFLQVLVQFDDPLLILLLLNSSNLLQLTGPLVLQHLLSETTKSHVLVAQVRAHLNL